MVEINGFDAREMGSTHDNVLAGECAWVRYTSFDMRSPWNLVLKFGRDIGQRPQLEKLPRILLFPFVVKVIVVRFWDEVPDCPKVVGRPPINITRACMTPVNVLWSVVG